ncbi:tyrosinase-like protein 1 [Argonauta hians]
MNQPIFVVIYFSILYISCDIYSDYLFPLPIEICLRELDESGLVTANDSTEFMSQCIKQFNSTLTEDFDHPWILTLYKPFYKLYKCKYHECKAKVTRKEYRQLSKLERDRYNSAVAGLRQDTSVPPNKFMALVFCHRDKRAQVAHGGPSFIIWHRLFLYMFEEALHQIDKDINLSYWDMTIDFQLNDASFSMMWTDEFMGNGFGTIRSGFYKDWANDRGYVRRYLADNAALPSKKRVKSVRHKPFSRSFERAHNASHGFIGMDMEDPSTSPSEPVFWLLHTFYDLIFDSFLQKKIAVGANVRDSYPPSDTYTLNRSISLVPISIEKALELGVLMSKYAYIYEPQPRCDKNKDGCNSSYLTCLKGKCHSIDRVCNDGPTLETYCKIFNCKKTWDVVSFSISANYSNGRLNCETPCTNSYPIHLYAGPKKQTTIFFNSTFNVVNAEIVTADFQRLDQIDVLDSCLNQCESYCKVAGIYTRCNKTNEPADYISGYNSYIKLRKDNNKTYQKNVELRNLLFICGNNTDVPIHKVNKVPQSV